MTGSVGLMDMKPRLLCALKAEVKDRLIKHAQVGGDKEVRAKLLAENNPK